MKNVVRKSVQIEFGGMLFPGKIQILPSISIHRGQNEYNFFRNYFAINFERIIFGVWFELQTIPPREKQNGEEICSFTSKKL